MKFEVRITINNCAEKYIPIKKHNTVVKFRLIVLLV